MLGKLLNWLGIFYGIFNAFAVLHTAIKSRKMYARKLFRERGSTILQLSDWLGFWENAFLKSYIKAYKCFFFKEDYAANILPLNTLWNSLINRSMFVREAVSCIFTWNAGDVEVSIWHIAPQIENHSRCPAMKRLKGIFPLCINITRPKR